jgi:hypothetical protein
LAPAPLSPDQLRGGAPAEAPTPLPDRAIAEKAGQAILQDALRRGQGAVKAPARSKTGLLLAFAALLFLGAIGYLGWIKREPLMAAVNGWLGYTTTNDTDIAAKSDSPTAPSQEKSPRPGIDPLPSSPLTEPTPAKSTTSARSTKLIPADIGKPTSPEPVVPALDDKISMAPTTTVPKVEPAPTQPPKALVVDEDEPSTAPVPTATPVEEVVTKAMPQSAPQLVEVGTSSPTDIRKTVTSARTKAEPLLGNESGPKVNNVPQEAQAGLDGLLKFLSAPNWDERLKYTMLPDQVRDKGAIYYQANPSGPIDVDEVHYLRHDTKPEVGSGTHCVFVLFGRAWEDGQHGIPVMVEVRGDEARVDWLTFIEFKDNMLRQFMSNPQIEGRWRFHVSMRRCHYFEDDVPDASSKDCFEIAPPMPGTTDLYAFLQSGSQLSRSLASTITWDKRVTWGIVELQWRQENGKAWVELTAVPQLNWYSAAAATDTSKAPTIPSAAPQQESRPVVPGSR